MNAITRKLLCGAVLAALPIGSALACTTGAWDNGVGNSNGLTETSAVAGGPETVEEIARYSGSCGLRPDAAGASFVMDNTPAAEGAASGSGGQPYRARFYMFTGAPGGAVKVFSASADDDGLGTERFAVTFDPSGPSLNFFPSGSTPVLADRWYSVEVFYQDGETINVTVEGAGTLTPTSVGAGTASGTIGSVRLGAIDAVAGSDAMLFDEFESTRSETTAIGRLCTGDASNDSVIDVVDATVVVAERLNQGLAVGQPDATEDGEVNVVDATQIVAWRLANPRVNCP